MSSTTKTMRRSVQSEDSLKKTNLPSEWVTRTSNKYPDRVYYFNIVTNKSSWSPPMGLERTSTKISAANAGKGVKRKVVEDEPSEEDERPEDYVPIVERPKAKAKRNIVKVKSNPEVIETPAMRAIKERMLEKKKAVANGNKPGRRSIQPKNVTPKNVPKPAEETNFTPAMQQVYERLQQRRSLGANVKCKTPKKSNCGSSSESTTSSSTLSSISTDSCISNASTLVAVNDTTEIKQPTTSALRRPLPQRTSLTSMRTRKRSIAEPPVSSNAKPSAPSPKSTRLIPQKQKTPELSESIVSNVSNTRKPMPVIKKNLANERLVKFRKSLRAENIDKVIPGKKTDKIENVGKTQKFQGGAALMAAIKKVPPEIKTEENPIDVTMPSYHINAEARFKNLEERVSRQQRFEESRAQTSKPESVESNEEPNEMCYEEMEWEPIEDEKIMSEVYAVRTELCTTLSSCNVDQVPENTLKLPNEPKQIQELYIVIDTNVFLSNLQAVEEVRDTTFKTFGRPFLVIPWTVIQELDYIKDDKSKTQIDSLKMKARRAVRFLNDHFSTKHPRVLGQTPMDAEKNREIFAKECPDDEILQTCLQIRNLTNSVVLLSYDKNLCNKAMIHDVATLGRNDPFEKIDYLLARNNEFGTLFSTLSNRLDNSSTSGITILQEELRIAEDIMEEGKAIVKTILSVVVAEEMELLFGEKWELYTTIRPPWSVIDVLKCAKKHWIAAVSQSFFKKGEAIIKTILELINKSPPGGRRLNDVLDFLETCTDLMQTLKVEKYPDMASRVNNGLKDQKDRCRKSITELNDKRLELTIGKENSEARQEQRAMVALESFDKVYTFARDTCGKAAEMVRMPCTFKYNESLPGLTNELVERLYSEVAANSNRLLQVLSSALEHSTSLTADHRVILELHDILTNFLPDINLADEMTLSPLDILCCVKRKRQVLKQGLTQLQELSINFCRMASFRCT